MALEKDEKRKDKKEVDTTIDFNTIIKNSDKFIREKLKKADPKTKLLTYTVYMSRNAQLEAILDNKLGVALELAKENIGILLLLKCLDYFEGLKSENKSEDEIGKFIKNLINEELTSIRNILLQQLNYLKTDPVIH